MSLRRNEVGHRISSRNAELAMRESPGQFGLYVDEDRQQRAGLFLRDVRYRLHARFEMTSRAGADDVPRKFEEMFRRRAIAGQCVNQPYLGCREFSARFRLVNDLSIEDSALSSFDKDLGFMLYDLDYADPASPRPLFFRAKAQHGVIQVPARDSDEVHG